MPSRIAAPHGENMIGALIGVNVERQHGGITLCGAASAD
jgi:hypothetical protein